MGFVAPTVRVLMAGLLQRLLGMAAMVHVLPGHLCTISDASSNVVLATCMPSADARARARTHGTQMASSQSVVPRMHMLMAGLMGMLLGMAAMVHVLPEHHCTISDASFNVVPSFCMPAADARSKQEVVPTYTSCTKLPQCSVVGH